MPRAIGVLTVKLNAKRFQTPVDVAGLKREDRIFSSFSLVFFAGILILFAAIWLFLLKSEDIAVPLIIKWVKLFKIREIFKFSLIDSDFIARLYRVFISIVLVILGAKMILQLLTYVFSVVVLSREMLIIVESSILGSRIHQIPYNRISRVSSRETILHRALGMGFLEIHDGERNVPLTFGPIPRFPALISRLAAEVSKR
jgi:hypothetical protein